MICRRNIHSKECFTVSILKKMINDILPNCIKMLTSGEQMIIVWEEWPIGKWWLRAQVRMWGARVVLHHILGSCWQLTLQFTSFSPQQKFGIGANFFLDLGKWGFIESILSPLVLRFFLECMQYYSNFEGKGLD